MNDTKYDKIDDKNSFYRQKQRPVTLMFYHHHRYARHKNTNNKTQ